jgi:hypothetical protein
VVCGTVVGLGATVGFTVADRVGAALESAARVVGVATDFLTMVPLEIVNESGVERTVAFKESAVITAFEVSTCAFVKNAQNIIKRRSNLFGIPDCKNSFFFLFTYTISG